jgi:hypothetical protein
MAYKGKSVTGTPVISTTFRNAAGFNKGMSMRRLFDGVRIKLFDGVPGTGSRVL